MARTAGSDEDDGPIAYVGRNKLTRAAIESLVLRKELNRIQMSRVPTVREVGYLNRVLDAHPNARLRLYGLHYLREVDLSSLNGLSALRFLTVEHELDDISFLPGLHALEGLSLRIKGKRTDLSPLAALPGLRHLGVGGRLKSLDRVAEARSLKTLSVSTKEAVDLSPLVRLPVLTTLSVSAKRVLDLSPLKDLSVLEALSVDAPSVESFEPVARMAHLKMLGLSVTKATSDDLRPLGRSSVQALSLTYMPSVVSLDFLSGSESLGALRLLELGGLESIAALPKLNLWTLAISLDSQLDASAVDDLAACKGIEFAIVAPNFFRAAGREEEYEFFRDRWYREGLNFDSWRDLVAERIGLERDRS